MAVRSRRESRADPAEGVSAGRSEGSSSMASEADAEVEAGAYCEEAAQQPMQRAQQQQSTVTTVASALRWAATLLLATALAACALYQLSQTRGGSEHAAQSLSRDNSMRQRFGDEFDPSVHPLDALLPARLRGDAPGERVHFMRTIAPKEDSHQWISACEVIPGKKPKPHHPHGHRGEVGVHEVATESLRKPAVARLSKQRAGAQAPKVVRDPLTGLHSYDAAAPHSSRIPEAQRQHHPWVSESNRFGFKRSPERNPSQACRFSASYRTQNAQQCAEASTADEDLHRAPEGTVEPPFKEVTYTLKSGRDTSCAAWGWFSDTLIESGWNYLYVESNGDLDDEAQARAAGFVEGALSMQSIYEHKTNEFEDLFPPHGRIDSMTQSFINDMTAYALREVAQKAPTEAYWQQVGLMYQQLQGMYEGFSAVNNDTTKAVSYFELLLLQYDGDMADIQGAVMPDLRVKSTDSLQRIMTYLIEQGHCSVLVSRSQDHAELFAAHDTWAGYGSTHRVFKAYRMPFHDVKATAVHFSSYPAFVWSSDDFYQTEETQLAIIETTNDIINASLYDLVDSSTVPTWGRAMLATRLASGGEEWTAWFGQHNSGTYNNQWMIIDYSLFRPNHDDVRPGTFWITEQMPGAMYSADKSAHLQAENYWASFNRPYFTPVYDAMGYGILNATYGPFLFGYAQYFRALQFARAAPSVKTLADMQRIMSYNEWQTDPTSRNNSGFAISARFDLSTYDPVPSLGFFYRGAWGAYDVKVTAAAWMQSERQQRQGGVGADAGAGGGDLSFAPEHIPMRVSAINGPTHRDQTPFTWKNPEWTRYASHLGLPETYAFNFVQMSMPKAARK